MKIDVPKIIRPLDLREYAPEMGTEIQVWVNPPRAKVLEMAQLEATSGAIQQRMKEIRATESEVAAEEARKALEELEQTGQKIMVWFAEMWSQGPDPESHLTLEEVQKLVEHSVNTDPVLWPWLCGRTRAMINEHRTKVKKG
jgi:hypothetical protein